MNPFRMFAVVSVLAFLVPASLAFAAVLGANPAPSPVSVSPAFVPSVPNDVPPPSMVLPEESSQIDATPVTITARVPSQGNARAARAKVSTKTWACNAARPLTLVGFEHPAGESPRHHVNGATPMVKECEWR